MNVWPQECSESRREEIEDDPSTGFEGGVNYFCMDGRPCDGLDGQPIEECPRMVPTDFWCPTCHRENVDTALLWDGIDGVYRCPNPECEGVFNERGKDITTQKETVAVGEFVFDLLADSMRGLKR
jgi:hypothetical protein